MVRAETVNWFSRAENSPIIGIEMNSVDTTQNLIKLFPEITSNSSTPCVIEPSTSFNCTSAYNYFMGNEGTKSE